MNISQMKADELVWTKLVAASVGTRVMTPTAALGKVCPLDQGETVTYRQVAQPFRVC
jgi:hypothetical protein